MLSIAALNAKRHKLDKEGRSIGKAGNASMFGVICNKLFMELLKILLSSESTIYLESGEKSQSLSLLLN